MPVWLEKLLIKQHGLFGSFFHLRVGKSDCEMDLLFFPLNHLIVEEVHSSLPELRSIEGKFVGQLRYLGLA